MSPTTPSAPRLLRAPDGTEPERFEARVGELRRQGMPAYVASKLAREEALGVREIDGPLKRTWASPYLQVERAERLKRPEFKVKK